MISQIITCFCLLISFGAMCQPGLKNAPGTKFIEAKNSDSFLISAEPITNREYIIYLSWIYQVYGADYPEVFLKSFPAIHVDENVLINEGFYESVNPFSKLLKHSPEFVRNYIFNPAYIDYPIVGLSNFQASLFCKWLSDRYNENTLIQRGYFNPNYSQINEDCFVTESYLSDQYYGARVKEETIKWSDRLLIPAFRLPTGKELELSKPAKISNEIRAYPFDSSSFLNQWNQYYLQVYRDSICLKIFIDSSEVIRNSMGKSKINFNISGEMILDGNKTSGNSVLKIFQNNGQNQWQYQDFTSTTNVEKDSLGQMPFIIIDESDAKQPVIVERYRSDQNNNEADKLFIFRFACSMKRGQYVLE